MHSRAPSLRIVYVISGLGTGGAEMMLFKLLENCQRLRNGQVISLNEGGPMSERIRSLGVQVSSLNLKPTFPNPISVYQLFRAVRQASPHVVSTWMYHADLLGGLAAKAAGIPVVWGIRNSTLGNQTKRTTRAIVRTCSLLSRSVPSLIISCSSRAREVHEALGYDGTKFRIVPNGFDLESFRPLPAARSSIRQELGEPDDAVLIGLVARFDPQKDHAGFLRAAAIVHAKRPRVRFVLIGPGVDSSNSVLARLVHSSGLKAAVSMLGARTDMPRLMAGLDVLVSSSLYGEAFPNVLGEAMASGVPCVTTDVGDSAEIVGDAGFVVPPGQPAALAEGIARALELGRAGRAALGDRARERVRSRFSIQSSVARYEQVFEEAVRAFRNGSARAHQQEAK